MSKSKSNSSVYNRYDICIGNEYESNNCGKYKVLKFRKKGKVKGYDIKFINTGHKKWYRIKDVKLGSVYDNTISKELFLGRVFNSISYGKFVLVGVGYHMDNTKKNNRKHYVIKFLDTGHQQSVQSHHLWVGDIIDRFFHNVNIGYTYESDNQLVTVIGRSRNGKDYIVKGHESNSIWCCRVNDIRYNKFTDFLSKNKLGNSYGYSRYIEVDNLVCSMLNEKWNDMIKRCYDVNNIGYKYYGKVGTIVSDEWTRFDNFLLDVLKIEGFDKDRLLNHEISLDKDKLQSNVDNKIYSKDTCCWLSIEDNKELSTNKNGKIVKKYFKAIRKDIIVYFTNRRKFCERYDLNYNSIQKYLNNNRMTYKDWKFERVNKNEFDNAIKNRDD
jgi:hydrogenase maturation factor